MAIPHFDLPFRINGSRGAVVNEQDSEEEITDCVELILRYPNNHRPERPEFGIPDLTFSEPKPDTTLIQIAVAEFEPRAVITICDPKFNSRDSLVTSIRVMINDS